MRDVLQDEMITLAILKLALLVKMISFSQLSQDLSFERPAGSHGRRAASDLMDLGVLIASGTCALTRCRVAYDSFFKV